MNTYHFCKKTTTKKFKKSLIATPFAATLVCSLHSDFWVYSIH